MIDVAPLRYGVIFKKGFCDPEVFTAFVRDFLGLEMHINQVEMEKSFYPPIGNVDSRFDLFAQDHEKRIIVDIQHARHLDHYHRFLHYHCAALLELVSSADDYQPPLQVYTMVVLTSGDRHKRDVSTIDFDPKDLKGKSLGEIPHKVIYICPKYVNEDTPEPYQEWMRAIDDSLDKKVNEEEYTCPAILKLFDHIKADLISPQERAAMKDEYSYQLLENKAFEKGEEKGIADGILLGKLEVARRLIDSGADWSVIEAATGIDQKRYKALINSHHDKSQAIKNN